ncbi:hypothetical protein OROMI_014288 [Orobanche minor]
MREGRERERNPRVPNYGFSANWSANFRQGLGRGKVGRAYSRELGPYHRQGFPYLAGRPYRPVNRNQVIAYDRFRSTTVSGKVEDVLTLYVSNFSPMIKAEALAAAIGDCGQLLEVFIPHKLNKERKRFAFTRFVGVMDMQTVLAKVKVCWVGNFKLLANPSRFSSSAESRGIRRVESLGQPIMKAAWRRVDVNYATVAADRVGVGEQRPVGRADVQQVMQQDNQGVMVSVDVDTGRGKVGGVLDVVMEEDSELKARADRCLVCRLSNSITLVDVEEWLRNDGLLDVILSRLSADLVVLEPGSVELGEVVRSRLASWKSKGVLEVKSWDYDCTYNKQAVWVHVYGVPLSHGKFGSLIGDVIHVAEETVDRQVLSFGRVCVETTRFDVVRDLSVLVVGDKRFVVRIIEEGHIGFLDIQRLGGEPGGSEFSESESSKEFSDRDQLHSSEEDEVDEMRPDLEGVAEELEVGDEQGQDGGVV